MQPQEPDNYATHINPQLLRLKSWLLHKNKKPHYVSGRPRSGTLDAPADLKKLAAFDDAVAAMHTGNWTGIGIAVNGGLQFIDLDKCRDPATGKVAEWVPPVLKLARSLGAYIEISISGTGIHILGFGESFPTFKGKHVECYSHGRYMAMGVEVLQTGADPLPDLRPLLTLLDVDSVPRQKPALRLVTGKPAKGWTVRASDARKLLPQISPDIDYPEWIAVGMALHEASGGVEEGLEMWVEWSRGGEKYKDGECARHWAGFKLGGGVGFGSLVHLAQRADAAPGASRESVSSPVIELPEVDTPKRRTEFSDDELMEAEHPDIPWLVEGLIMPGLTLLAAPPKMGKSYLVLQMGLCVGAGVPFLGRQTRKVPVSYFDLEEWEELLQRRRKHIGKANGIVRSQVSYALETTGGDVTVLHDIDRHIREKGSQLVIIDLLARVRDELGEDAKKNAYARDYAALRKFADFILQRHPHVAIVLVHHTNKGNHDDWQAKISGSQGLAGASHTNMLMTHVDLRGMDDDARAEALKYRKLHVAGKAVEPAEMMLEMMPDGGGWQPTEKTSEEVKTFGKHAHILQVLREANGAWVTAKEVKEVVEGTLDSIKRMLARMAKRGEVESGGQGGPGYRLRDA